jgi:four helix bundle protein
MGEEAPRKPARRAHRDLLAWQEAMQLVSDIYATTSTFPKEEAFGLVAQMRRCAISIPSNIAEGAARKSRSELVYFLTVAQGSLSELDTQVEIARRLGFVVPGDSLQHRMDRVFSLLLGLSRSLKPKNP